MNFFYIASYGLKYHTMIIISQKLNNLNTNAFWKALHDLNDTSSIKDKEYIHDTFYWLNSGKFLFNFLRLNF